MARYPAAVQKILPENATQAHIDPRVVVLHSAAAAGSPWHYFLTGSNLESTFFVALDGTVEQFMDSNVRADANYKANGFSGSVETENHPDYAARGDWDNDPWTPEQIASLTQLCDWYATEHGVKRQLAESWDGHGFGWHIQFGTPGYWTGVAKACPGRRRIEQFNQIILPAICGHYTEGEAVTDADILRTIAGVDSILKDDFANLKRELNADITNAANRVIRDLGGSPSIANKS